MSKEQAIEGILFNTRLEQAEKKEPKPKPCKEVEIIDYYRNERSKCSYRK